MHLSPRKRGYQSWNHSVFMYILQFASLTIINGVVQSKLCMYLICPNMANPLYMFAINYYITLMIWFRWVMRYFLWNYASCLKLIRMVLFLYNYNGIGKKNYAELIVSCISFEKINCFNNCLKWDYKFVVTQRRDTSFKI